MGLYSEEYAVNILIIEDDPADMCLIRDTFKTKKKGISVFEVQNGIEAMAFLKKEGKYSTAPRPHLILLNLNLPHMDGRKVLSEIHKNYNLTRIPLIVLATIKSEKDILTAYDLNANCFIPKPKDKKDFSHTIELIEDFWLTHVKFYKD